MAQKRAAADLSRSGKRGTGESMRAKSAAPVVHDFSWQHVAACGSMWQLCAALTLASVPAVLAAGALLT